MFSREVAESIFVLEDNKWDEEEFMKWCSDNEITCDYCGGFSDDEHYGECEVHDA